MQKGVWSGVIGLLLCAACGGVSDPIVAEQSGGGPTTGGSSAGRMGESEPPVHHGTGGSTGGYPIAYGGAAGTSYGGGISYGGTASAGFGGMVIDPQPPVAPPPWIESCPAEPDTAFESRPLPSGTVEDLRAYLDDVRADMVGHWRGVATTPWVNPYPVALGFGADGHYTSVCLTQNLPEDCVAFYYGTDEDTDLKQYRIETLDIDGLVTGEIDIAFGYDDSYGLAGWQGLLENLQIDAAAQRMIFDFWRNDGYGPVSFELWRCGASE